MASAQILRAARGRIADPEHWTQWVLSKDVDGCICDATDDKAFSFCALGAVEAETGGNPFCGPEVDLLNKVSRELYCTPINRVNNYIGHTEVLRVFDAAIAAAEAEAR